MDEAVAGLDGCWLKLGFPSEAASKDRSNDAESSKGESLDENNVIVDVTVGDNLSIDAKGEEAAAKEEDL